MRTLSSPSFVNRIAIDSNRKAGSNRSLNIELKPATARSLTLKIYDVVGRVLFEKHTAFLNEDQTALDISDYSLGMYFLQLENLQGKVQTERFVINQ
ncbi:MAG: T9SS type A sorting domain-containing protein [Bacteroidota bacterium]|nr:T9SS type A sorting domain-containing protein [Bacteroidota bacterium]